MTKSMRLWCSATESLQRLEERVLRLEERLGDRHPHVGKAWLILSRTYQSQGTPAFADKAQQALERYASPCHPRPILPSCNATHLLIFD